MIPVDVRVAHLEDELVRVATGHERDHVGEERVRRNVEWHAEADVAAALVHEARELGARVGRLGERDVELAEHMAGWEGHEREI